MSKGEGRGDERWVGKGMRGWKVSKRGGRGMRGGWVVVVFGLEYLAAAAARQAVCEYSTRNP